MLNRVILMGRLTAIPELKTTQSGNSVTSFTVAVDRSYVKQGEERKADFITCVAWRNTAEFICRYFGKGSMIALEGQLQTRSYQAKDGTNRYVTEVMVDNVSFTGERREDNGHQQNGNGYNQRPQPQSQPQQNGYGQPQQNGYGYGQQSQSQQNSYGQAYQQAPPAYSSGADSDFGDMQFDDDLPF